MSEPLFVFGTLLSGYDHPMARRLAREARLIGPASCQGRLYRVAHYPGLVLSDDASDRVVGELYDVPGAELLAALDAYEGCGPDDRTPTEFVRRRHPVTCGGHTLQAWTYLYNRDVAFLPRIVPGDFLRYIARSRS